jgi:hypothetical protein
MKICPKNKDGVLLKKIVGVAAAGTSVLAFRFVPT